MSVTQAHCERVGEGPTARDNEVVALNAEQYRQRNLATTAEYQLVESSVELFAEPRSHVEAVHAFARQNANEATQISRVRREMAVVKKRVDYIERFLAQRGPYTPLRGHPLKTKNSSEDRRSR